MFSTAPQKGMCPIDSSTSVSNIYGEQLWNHIGAAQRGPLFLPPTRATNGGTEPNIDGPCPSQNQTFQPPSPYSQAPTPSPQPTATIIHVCTGRQQTHLLPAPPDCHRLSFFLSPIDGSGLGEEDTGAVIKVLDHKFPSINTTVGDDLSLSALKSRQQRRREEASCCQVTHFVSPAT